MKKTTSGGEGGEGGEGCRYVVGIRSEGAEPIFPSSVFRQWEGGRAPQPILKRKGSKTWIDHSSHTHGHATTGNPPLAHQFSEFRKMLNIDPPRPPSPPFCIIHGIPASQKFRKMNRGKKWGKFAFEKGCSRVPRPGLLARRGEGGWRGGGYKLGSS